MPASNEETLRDLLTGFTAMKAQLGLLPVNTGASALGISPSVAPPPAPAPSPSDAALAAVAQQQAMMNNTIQMAQVTRYQPPPSAPTPSAPAPSVALGWQQSMGQMGAGLMNPYMADALGGSVGMPNPALMTPPMFGGFRRGFGGPPMGVGGPARLPSVFNPFAPTLPSPAFSEPAPYHEQLQQRRADQVTSLMTGAVHFGLGAGGEMLGSVLGSAFGPVGTVLGGLAGRFLGSTLGNVITGPVLSDISRGREIQRMTSPFMVTGAMLNPLTGTGVSREAGMEIARGIRHLWRDLDFERTGFNTSDAMRIMSLSAQQGLLIGAQSPEQIVGKVKELSKTVKMIMQITGDPDFQSAIRSLGEMRGAGFMGLPAQSQAVQNRAMFARMAGVSIGQMAELQQAGGMQAVQAGLASAVGYSATASGAAMANVAVSSGALNEMQLARVGGSSGLGQTLAQMGIAAVNSPIHMAAALTRDAQGRLTIDPSAWRRVQGLSTTDVAGIAAERMRSLGVSGIQELYPQMGELKSRLSQQLNPVEMQLAAIKQAQGLVATGAATNLGAAFMAMGMDEASARSAQLVATSREFYRGLRQQVGTQMRQQAIDQQRRVAADRATPGFFTMIGRNIRGDISTAGEVLSSPFRFAADFFQDNAEVEAAAEQGQHIRRYDEIEVVRDEADRQMMDVALPGFLRDTRGGTGLGRGVSNVVSRSLGGVVLTGLTGLHASRVGQLAYQSYGHIALPFIDSLGGSLNYSQSALERVQDVAGVAAALQDAQSQSVAARVAVSQRLDSLTGGRGESILSRASINLANRINKLTAGMFEGATALGLSDVKEAYVTANKGREAEAAQEFDKDPRIAAALLDQARQAGYRTQQEVLDRSAEIGLKAGALDFTGDMTGLRKKYESQLDDLMNFSDYSKQEQGEFKSFLKHHTDEEVALAAIITAQTSGSEKQQERALQEEDMLKKRMGDKAFRETKARIIKEIASAGEGGANVLANLGGDIYRGTDEDLGAYVHRIREKIGDRELVAATEELGEYLRGLGVHDLSGSIPEMLSRVSDERLDQMEDQHMADLIRRGRKVDQKGMPVDQKAIKALLNHFTASQREVSHGTTASAEAERIQGEIADLEEKATKEGVSPEDQLLLSADKLEVAAEKLSAVADKIVGNREKADFVKDHPWFQSMY